MTQERFLFGQEFWRCVPRKRDPDIVAEPCSGRAKPGYVGRSSAGCVKSLMRGDCYEGRASKQRGLLMSRFANPYKVARYCRELVTAMYSHDLETVLRLWSSLWILSGLRLICHCAERQSCHVDTLTAAHEEDFPRLSIGLTWWDGKSQGQAQRRRDNSCAA